MSGCLRGKINSLALILLFFLFPFFFLQCIAQDDHPPPPFQKYPQSSCCHTHKHKFTMAVETTTNILVMALPTSRLSVIQAALFSTAIFPSPGGTSPHWSHLSEWNLIDSWVICHLISVSESPGPIPSLFSQSVSAAVSVRVFWKKLSFKKE